MQIDALVCDLDGTLLNNRKELTPYTCHILHQLQAQGVKVILATGRNDIYVKAVAASIPSTEPIIACNGASVRNLWSGEIICKTLLPEPAVRTIAAYCLDRGYDFTVSVYDAMYYAQHSRRVQVFHDYNATVKEIYKIPLYAIRSLTDIPLNRTLKMFVWDLNDDDRQTLFDILDDENNVDYVCSEKGGLDLVAKGCSKGAALRHLAAWYNIPLNRIAAFGDHYNDISLLKTVGYSFAMRNAEKAVQESAQYITEFDNHSDGVAKALEHYFL